jgi:Ca2+-binding EF-hand superfamily protein
MSHYTKLLLAITLLISTSSLVHAKSNEHTKNGPPPRPSFKSIDLNKDGVIDFYEFSSHKIPRGDHQTVFNKIDSDNNGILSNDEFINHKRPRREKSTEENNHD